MSASVNLPLHHKVQEFSSGTGLPGWSQKKGHKMVVVVVSAEKQAYNFELCSVSFGATFLFQLNH